MKTHINIDRYNFTVETIDQIPEGFEYSQDYSRHYRVTLFGKTVLFLAKGHQVKPKQIVVWYAATKRFHRSYGMTFREVIELAMEDVWAHIGI